MTLSDLRSLLLASFTQDTRLLSLYTPLPPDELLVECMRGEEALSHCYQYRVSALSTNAGISLRALIGQPVLLTLETALASGATDRPFHGHVTAIEHAGADGGLARYELTIGPWLAFLGRGRDSRVFQDKTVFGILDAIFAGWQRGGSFVPRWRYDIADRSVYPARSLTCQYQESDLAFVERLMHEAGLFYYFEHEGDPDGTDHGSHTMVIADHNGAFVPNPQALIRYTQPGAVMKEDSMDRWRTTLQQRTSAVSLCSWDYRSRDTRPLAAAGTSAGPELTCRDVPGIYAYESREQGQRLADMQMEAIEAAREIHVGAGTVRTLATGTTFSLADHARYDTDTTFVITRVLHLAHNNLSSDLKTKLGEVLGQGRLDIAMAEEQRHSLHAVGAEKGERPLYRNRIDAIDVRTPYRSTGLDGRGMVRNPRPTVLGQQTATVVGTADAAIHTDRDHRVKVQFHWQRGKSAEDQSHNRLTHPHSDGHSGAPANADAGTWVRIAAPLAPIAGANWGAVAVPRIGSEVVIDFLDGDIDRPVVIGSVYNGSGASDAQNNQVARGAGVATGNAPSWFPGIAGGHAHPAVLSGLKSQAMSASQLGTGAFNQLVFDDSAGQSRLVLQQHGQNSKGNSELNLGHLRHQNDNRRLAHAGLGAELKTEHAVAARAGQGMLMTAHGRPDARGSMLDAREAASAIDAAVQLQVALATTAQKHKAGLTSAGGAPEPAPEQLEAVRQLTRSARTLRATTKSGTDGAGGEGSAIAFPEPHMQLAAPAGIVATTPASTIVAAGADTSITAGQDINLTSQANSHMLAEDGISMFTYGKATEASKPNQETGIRLHTASGKVCTQSQTGETRITADKAIKVASVTDTVGVAAKTHILMTAQGASLRLEGGNIMLHGPGKMEFKAGMKELTGPAKSSPDLPAMPVPASLPNVFSQQLNALNFIGAGDSGEALVNVPYSVRDKSGRVLARSTTDAEGDTQRFYTKEKEEVDVFLGEGEWRVFIDVAHEFAPSGDDVDGETA